MPHTTTYNSRDHVIEIKVQGDLTLHIVKEIVSEVIQVSKEHDCLLILNDLREATIKLSTVQIYQLPKVFIDMAASSGIDIYKFRRALVAQKGLEDLDFFETVSVNSAQNAKYFSDIDTARSWLLEK